MQESHSTIPSITLSIWASTRRILQQQQLQQQQLQLQQIDKRHLAPITITAKLQSIKMILFIVYLTLI